MFVIRKIFKDSVEYNLSIGNHYDLVDKERSPEEFNLIDENTYESPDMIYAYIVYAGGSKIEPLYNTQQNYIMNEDGGLFANVSKKK